MKLASERRSRNQARESRPFACLAAQAVFVVTASVSHALADVPVVGSEGPAGSETAPSEVPAAIGRRGQSRAWFGGDLVLDKTRWTGTLIDSTPPGQSTVIQSINGPQLVPRAGYVYASERWLAGLSYGATRVFATNMPADGPWTTLGQRGRWRTDRIDGLFAFRLNDSLVVGLAMGGSRQSIEETRTTRAFEVLSGQASGVGGWSAHAGLTYLAQTRPLELTLGFGVTTPLALTGTIGVDGLTAQSASLVLPQNSSVAANARYTIDRFAFDFATSLRMANNDAVFWRTADGSTLASSANQLSRVDAGIGVEWSLFDGIAWLSARIATSRNISGGSERSAKRTTQPGPTNLFFDQGNVSFSSAISASLGGVTASMRFTTVWRDSARASENVSMDGSRSIIGLLVEYEWDAVDAE